MFVQVYFLLFYPYKRYWASFELIDYDEAMIEMRGVVGKNNTREKNAVYLQHFTTFFALSNKVLV